MAAQQSFRTSFNGFHKEDVVRYIEYLNSTHTAQVNQLTSELEFLRANRALPAESSADRDAVIEQQAARIRELFDRNQELEQRLQEASAAQDALNSKLNEALCAGTEMEAAKSRLAADLETAIEHQSSYRNRMEEELTAYRRAESTERIARERAEQMYRQANGTIADATAKVDEAATQISQLADKVSLQLAELQSAISGTKQTLRDASATMYTIRSSGV